MEHPRKQSRYIAATYTAALLRMDIVSGVCNPTLAGGPVPAPTTLSPGINAPDFQRHKPPHPGK